MRARLGKGLKIARGKRSQYVVADAAGVRQPTVSRWENTTQGDIFSIDKMLKIEAALGVSPGTILRAAGLIDVPGVIEAIDADPALNDAARDHLKLLYRGTAAS